MFMPAISQAYWEDDDNILLMGVVNDFRQLLRFSPSTGKLTQLTHATVDQGATEPEGDDVARTLRAVAQFQLRGDSLVYVTPTFLRQRPLVKRVPAVVLTDQALSNLHYAGIYGARVFTSYPAGSKPMLAASCIGQRAVQELSMSPNGRWAVVVCTGGHPGGADVVFDNDAPRRRFFRQQFILVDVRGGSGRVIASGSIKGRALAQKAVWSPDGTRVSLVYAAPGNYCPTPSGPSSAESGAFAQILVYDVDSGRISCPQIVGTPDELSSTQLGRVRGVHWIDGGKWLVFDIPSPASSWTRVFYGLHGNVWKRRSASASATPVRSPRTDVAAAWAGFSVEVRQASDRPWTIVATSGSHEIPLIGPDPVLEGVNLARETPVEWTFSGQVERGGLILPVNSVGQARLPLVIQTGGYHPDVFNPDGSASTAFAAQLLAAQGIAVLNFDPYSHALAGQPQAFRRAAFVKRIDAAVKTLSRKGIIDSRKVGLIGFSHGGFLTYYAITHPGETALAAAIDADGWTGSYGFYYMDSAWDTVSSVAEDYKAAFGGSFWDEKATWLDEAPSFNIEKVKTPVLFTLNTSRESILASETIGAFRLMARPFEFILFPEGDHQLQRPSERRASLQASVAWMMFWLQGREDHDFGDGAAYDRWREMRNQARIISQ